MKKGTENVILSCALMGVIALSGAVNAASAQLQPTMGFESTSAGGQPSGWGSNGRGYEIVVDSNAPFAGRAVAVVFGVLHPGNGTAWYDSLTIEGVGGPMPRMIAAAVSIPRPVDDLTRLLSDAELKVPGDSVVLLEDAEYSAWIRGHAHPIRSLGASDFSDLKFFAPLLAGKRIVQLGESGHGVAEFGMAKVRLIRYLHEELGYDVIAFESSTYECERAQHDIASLAPEELMRACIFGVWHSAEVIPLFDYIKQTQATTHPLILAGFDEQTSSYSVQSRPAVFRSLLSAVDSSYARRVFAFDSTFLASRQSPKYVKDNETSLVRFYDSLATFLRTNREAIDRAHRDDTNGALIARQAAISMTFLVRQLAAGLGASGTEIRDRGMADNLDFLLDELYPGKKLLVWGHNFHLQYRENTRNVAPLAANSQRTMGTWVAERHRSEVYTIGLFMYRGTAATNDRSVYPIRRAAPGSLESILHQVPWRYSFVDFTKVSRERGSEWMWKPIFALSWGTTAELLVPRDEFDAVLFIDTVRAPAYR